MDPIFETAKAFIETLIANPVVGPILIGAIRSATGYIQKKWKGQTGKDFDKKVFGATLIKYSIAINAIAMLLPANYKYLSALVLVADIIASWANKLR